MLKKIHYTGKINEHGGYEVRMQFLYLLYSVVCVTGGIVVLAMILSRYGVFAGIHNGVATFCQYVLVSARGTLYQLYWLLSAAVVLYGFAVLGWFRIMTKITTVLLFLVLRDAVEGIGELAFMKNVHDAIHVFLIPAYEAGYILTAMLVKILWPLISIFVNFFENLFSIQPFPIITWILNHTISDIPSSYEFHLALDYIRADGALSSVKNSLAFALSGNGYGLLYSNMNWMMTDFFDFLTYFLIMYVLVDAFFRVSLFFSSCIQHGLMNYFTIDNEDMEELERNPNVQEVLNRSKRRHPFKMPWRISIRQSASAFRNAYVTSRKSVYIDPDYINENKGVLAHELGHVVHGDSIAARVANTFYLSVFVSLFATCVSLFRTWTDNILFFLIGCFIGGLLLTSISITLSVANIATSVLFMFTGKWKEFMADMYAVYLGYGNDLIAFFERDNYERRSLKEAFFDPHPSAEVRVIYLKMATGVLEMIPGTTYWKQMREGR